MKIFDVTIPISETTPVWEGEKGVVLQRSAEIGDRSDYNVSYISLGLHAGTHMDAPFHVQNAGKTVDTIPLEKLIGPTQVVEIPKSAGVIDRATLKGIEIDESIKRILFKTENSYYWNNHPAQFTRDFVALDSSGAEYLISLGMELVGIDFFSISTYGDLLNPHKILLANSIVVIENLDLREVSAGVYQFYCFPLKVFGTDGAPVRAVLISGQ